MARIQTPQHVQELQAEFKVREAFGLELLETIQPTYALGLQKVASQGYPRKAFAFCAGAAGGVGTNVECIIRCPVNRGIILLLESWHVDNVGGEIQARADDGVLPTPIVGVQTFKQFRDTRVNPAVLPDAIIETSNPLTAAPNGQAIGQYTSIANDTLQVKADVVIGGGGYFLIRRSTANTALEVGFQWIEFLLEDR